MVAHILGYPRIGRDRGMKKAVEAYWKQDIDKMGLAEAGRQLRAEHWAQQAGAGLTWVTVGDFSWYDHVLDMSLLLGVIPERFRSASEPITIDTAFRMARGRAPSGEDAHACEMTKWFDTNYHYIVPEFSQNQSFAISSEKLFDEIAEAQAAGYAAKVTLLGPLTYLYLGKEKAGHFERLELLDALLPAYNTILARLAAMGVEWVQLDEPILTLDLEDTWKAAFESAYTRLEFNNLKSLVATYFGGLGDNVSLACHLPCDGIHIDLVRAPEQLEPLLACLPTYKILSVGVVDGRNVWRAHLEAVIDNLQDVHQRLGDNLWIGTSCSLLHCPLDLEAETQLDPEIKQWLAFAQQKLQEIVVIDKALSEGGASVAAMVAGSTQAWAARGASTRVHNSEVQTRLAQVDDAMASRQHTYAKRAQTQQSLNLPLFPTTSIGSFPQTTAIRRLRRDFKQGHIDLAEYEAGLEKETEAVVRKQEALGLDVLVHGEAERNDMVEYFGELLSGFLFTKNGWVQSYGSRCVKPPIIYGDVSREQPMTVRWATFAQGLSKRPVKGMLTGPVTMLMWSFVRDDQPRSTTALQIALALRDEVADLEQAGIRIIQIDEPAFREGLPLRKADWQDYLKWAVYAFRISSCAVNDATQIHTHMCYAEFNDIIEAIADLDADVITIESSRSQMELLHAFERFSYPNAIGPGVYDIHSPRVPDSEEIRTLLEKAMQRIPAARLWVNPDCGLKTREWPETEQALTQMVEAAKQLRERHAAKSA